MKRKLVGILACPVDKHVPLELVGFEGSEEVVRDGILICLACRRYYPIIDGVPVLLPDELRTKKDDIAFLRKWRGSIPESTATNGLPWNLTSGDSSDG